VELHVTIHLLISVDV